ncbi:hypothetical protein CBR_g40188 [Chara braunii]|uniref:Reverse transcriptase domain-containing protein n=1 Tax=Chara braunii TaxID=69332 RepID=A0A388LTB0_CHABU|nr:hypothetical protein CBR_g40188 [Chara braunii]|eukprot:GBG85550.1 hypothetical protein CBR_g40188 [Chara braunii]
MPEGGSISDGAGRVLTLEDLIAALDRHEKTPSNVRKVETFRFDGERVSDWLDLVEQAMVGLSDEVKFQRIMRYVLHRHHQEVQKVVDVAHGSWARFRESMLRKYRLSDGLFTISDLEAMNRDDFTTIGAFVQEFKKKAKKVHGIYKETQCAIFLGLLTASEAAELTSHGGGSAKLTWATIDRGVEDESLDQVEQHQMRLQRRKRKERDAIASGTPGVRRIVTDVLTALGYGQDAEAQKQVAAIVQGRGKEAGDEGGGQEDYGGEETRSQILTKAQRKQRNLLLGGQGSGKGQVPQAVAASPAAAVTAPVSTGPAPMGPPPACGHWVPYCLAAPWPSCSHCTSCGGSQAHTGQMVPFSGPPTSAGPPSFPATQGQFTAQPPPSQQASQASVAGGGGQGQGGQGNGGRGQGGRGGGGRSRNGGGRGGRWNSQGGQGQGDQGSQQEGQGYGRPRFNWRNATCWYCGVVGHTIRFCQQRRDDELAGLISSCMDGDIYDKWGEHIDPKTPGGIKQETLRRAAAGPSATPAMFRMWQEREDPAIRIEEITGDSEEVTQRLKARAIKEEPIVVEPDDEGREDEGEPTVTTLEKMEDLMEKMGRYQRRLKELCDEVQGWKADLPKVFLYETGRGSAAGQQSSPGVAMAGSGPRSGMMFRPPTPHGRAPQATQTRSQSKAGPSQPPSQAPSQAPPRKRPKPERRKEVVKVQEEEGEEDDKEDERLRQEEDRQTEQRAQRREVHERAEPGLQEGVPRKRKYTVRLEEEFDVETMVDRLLEGHNDLMNLKDILTSSSRLREELKGRLSQRLVPNVHLSAVLPREVGWTQAGTRMDWKCAACGLVDLVVKEKKCVAMMDTGAEMNIIRERDALMLGMEIDRADPGVLHGANCKAVFCGTASNVIIEIGKVRVRTCFFVMQDVDHPILLGRSFMCRTKTLIFNKHDGTMILLLSDLACGNYEIVTCRNTGPGSERNRPNPGSFTYVESENERRRLAEESEEEGGAEVLSLSLTGVSKAMEIVTAHEMADPEAIKALREHVLECPQAGEVELIYRLPGGRKGSAMTQAQTTSRLFLGRKKAWFPDYQLLFISIIDTTWILQCLLLHPLYQSSLPLVISLLIFRNEHENRATLFMYRFVLPLGTLLKLMVQLIKKRHRAYAFNNDQRGRLDVDKIPMIRIHTVPHEPWNLRGARYPNPDEEKMVVDYLDGKVHTHVAGYSSGPYPSPWFCFIKPNGMLQWVQDLQRLNAVTVRDARGLPNADALSESCAGRLIISLIDLYSGYDQFPVYPPNRLVTAMHTPRGLIHMNVAPQGWTNAVAMVQRHMIRAMQTVSLHITQPYIDDLAVKGPKEKEEDEVQPGVRRFVGRHIQDLDRVLGLLEEYNLTASGPKSKHCMRETTILGFVCNEKGRKPNVKKTSKILEWPVSSQTITVVRSFLGTCGFWRSFVKDFAAKTKHLRKLVRRDQEWVWGEDQEEAVTRMKGEFKEGGLVLGALNYEGTKEKSFIIETDAGPTALGGVLIQADAEGKERPLRFERKEPDEAAQANRAKVRARLAEIHERRDRMKAAGIAPTPPVDPKTSEQRINELWVRYEGRREAVRQRARETGRAIEGADEAIEIGELVFSATRKVIEWVDKEIKQTSVTVFQRYLLLSDELTLRKDEVEQLTAQLAEERVENKAWRARLEAKEAEWEAKLKEMAAAVERLAATKVIDWTEQSRYDIQGKGVQGLFGQEEAAEAARQEKLGKVFLDPAEAEARKEANKGSFDFKAPTELASQQEAPTPADTPMESMTQEPQPAPVEEGAAEESLAILLDVHEGTLTGVMEPPQFEAQGKEPSHLDELVAAMEVDMPPEEPREQRTPEHEPEMGELRAQLGSWATGTDSGGLTTDQRQQEATSQPTRAATPQTLRPREGEEAAMAGETREGRPLRLDTPEYQPEGEMQRGESSAQRIEGGTEEPWHLPQSHEASKEKEEAPPPSGTQKRKKRFQRKSEAMCFYFLDGVHRALECPKFLKDKAEGRVTEQDGKMYDRQGRVVERAPDGGRSCIGKTRRR